MGMFAKLIPIAINRQKREVYLLSFFHYTRQMKAWREGVTHITLDPEGPGVVRLHMIPPKPSIWKPQPSQLLINGTYLFPIGPSWAVLLKAFFAAIETYGKPGMTFSDEMKLKIDDAVFAAVHKEYHFVSRALVVSDLQELLEIVIHVSHGKPIPPELGGNAVVPLHAMTAPHRMDLMVAPMALAGKKACPLECGACYAKEAPAMSIETPLSTEEWCAIIDRCRAAGTPMLTFTGGEPLTRPDLVSLVNHAAWFITRVNTSAVNLTEELAQGLKGASLDGIQITLYSHVPEVHDALVGVEGAFERTLIGIKNAVNAGLEVSLNTPLVTANRDYLPLIDFAHTLGICHLTCSGLIPVGGAVDQMASGEALTKEALAALLKEALERCRAYEMNLSFTSPGWLTEEQIHAIGLPSVPLCGACASNMAVTPAGFVVPCQSWLDGNHLGNLLKTPWHQIWSHPTCKELRQKTALKPACALEGQKRGEGK